MSARTHLVGKTDLFRGILGRSVVIALQLSVGIPEDCSGGISERTQNLSCFRRVARRFVVYRGLHSIRNATLCCADIMSMTRCASSAKRAPPFDKRSTTFRSTESGVFVYALILQRRLGHYPLTDRPEKRYNQDAAEHDAGRRSRLSSPICTSDDSCYGVAADFRKTLPVTG
jgi:hypothetical protein